MRCSERLPAEVNALLTSQNSPGGLLIFLIFSQLAVDGIIGGITLTVFHHFRAFRTDVEAGLHDEIVTGLRLEVDNDGDGDDNARALDRNGGAAVGGGFIRQMMQRASNVNKGNETVVPRYELEIAQEDELLNDECPEAFRCPISFQMMKDPVIAA